MVVKYTGEDLYKSTYASLYRKTPSDTKQRRKHHQLPCLVGSESGYVVSRHHPDYIGTRKYVRPPGLASDHPLCLGLGSYVSVSIQNADKPIVRMKRPQDRLINLQGLLDTRQKAGRRHPSTKPESLDDLITRLRWISTIKREERNNCLRVPKWKVSNTTLEPNSDMVRHRPQRHEQSAGDWQKVSDAWNRVQFRPNLNDLSENSSSGKGMSINAEGTIWNHRQKVIQELTKLEKPISMSEQCKNRTLPGYAGFVPREPVESTFDPSSSEIYRSSASGTYRPFPHDVMHDSRTMSNHCQAPLSRMVTLVYPCNPFKRTPSTMHTCINPIYH